MRPTTSATARARARAEPGTARRPRHRRAWVAGGVVAGLAVVVGLSLLAGAGHKADPVVPDGEVASDFELPNVEPGGPAVSLARLRGRPVVMNFWASWCTSCRREMRAFEAVHDRLGPKVAFLGVNHKDQRGPALALMDETGMSFPSGYDPQGKVGASYELFGLPTTVFIAPEGTIAGRRTGEMTEPELEAAIRRLFDR